MDLLVTHLDTYSRLGIPKLHHLVAFEAEDQVEEGKKRSLFLLFFFVLYCVVPSDRKRLTLVSTIVTVIRVAVQLINYW